MNLFQKLAGVIRRKRLILEDPVFGEIEYCRRPKCWAIDQWPTNGKLSELREVLLDADETGPNESHRVAWQRMLEHFETEIEEIKRILDEDYQMWAGRLREEFGEDLRAVKGFPILQSPEEILDAADFFRITIAGDRGIPGMPGSDLWLTMDVAWEEEHGRDIFFRDGRVVDWGS